MLGAIDVLTKERRVKKMDLSKTAVTENSEDASSDSEVAQFYRPGLCHFVILSDLLCTIVGSDQRSECKLAKTDKFRSG